MCDKLVMDELAKITTADIFRSIVKHSILEVGSAEDDPDEDEQLEDYVEEYNPDEWPDESED